MVDIQSAAAEIRRGKKKEERKKETTGQKYNGPPYYIGSAGFLTCRGSFCHPINSIKALKRT